MQHAVHTFDHKPIDLEVIAMDRVTHPTPSHTHELVTAGGQSVTHDTKGNMLLIPTCVRANSSPSSGQLPGTLGEPWFWKHPSIESGKRSHKRAWECCHCKGNFKDESVATPNK
ncbi:MAG: hypothetical protein JNK90_19810 [Planctomycetaceae bacterium]|nr:hypothetical protein [Planctomycetaceae bacterium]